MATDVLVRACVNLAGLRYGDEARVDADDPYIAGLLQGGLLVQIEDAAAPETASDGEPEEPSEETVTPGSGESE